jgi:4-phytase/acid phosphatase
MHNFAAACSVIATTLALSSFCLGQTSVSKGEKADAPTLQRVAVLSRHGVRAPLETPEDLAKYSSDAWPKWDVPPGNLTSHGRQLMTSLGSFYASYFGSRRIFTGTGCERSRNTYVWSDVDERDISTAKGFLDGLFPGCTVQINRVSRGPTGSDYPSPEGTHGLTGSQSCGCGGPG